jgi:putative zinc finger/helix-turn-helix YgiT family protein
MKTARENFRYGESGLPVTLVGAKVSRCPKCGEFEVAIPRIDELNRAIAMEVIKKRARLTAAEVRFLRKYLNWSGVEFARHMGVTPGAVSRWENEREQIGPVAARLLRMIVAHRQPADAYSVEQLAEVAEEEPAPVRLGMEANEKGWHARAA